MKVVIESIGEVQSFGESGFTKREFVGIDNSSPEYPTPIKFEVVKDKCSELDKYSAGQEVDVEFNIRGNRWTNKQGVEVIFNSFSVWKISASTGTGDLTPQRDFNDNAVKNPEWLDDSKDGEDQDLPF